MPAGTFFREKKPFHNKIKTDGDVYFDTILYIIHSKGFWLWFHYPASPLLACQILEILINTRHVSLVLCFLSGCARLWIVILALVHSPGVIMCSSERGASKLISGCTHHKNFHTKLLYYCITFHCHFQTFPIYRPILYPLLEFLSLKFYTQLLPFPSQ